MFRRKNTSKTIIAAAVFLVMTLSAADVLSAPVKPTPGGLAASLGNYSTSMPSNPSARIYAHNYAYPTNKWWGSAYIYDPWSNYSLMMSLGTSYIKFQNSPPGYRLTPADPRVRNGQPLVMEGTTLSGTNETGYLQLCISSVTGTYYGYNYINPVPLKVINYSDWAVTAEIKDSLNPDLKMTTTFLKGGVFVYSTFSPGTYPQFRFGWKGNPVKYDNRDGGILLIRGQWYAIYGPEGTSFDPRDNDWSMEIVLPEAELEEDRYVIIAFLGNTSMYPDVEDVKPVFMEYRRYAYNFVTKTEVSWARNTDSSISTAFQYTVAPSKRTGDDFVSGQTLFALYPHQWRYLVSGSPNTVASAYTTLRGKMKVYQGASFTTKYEFNGILPNLTYEVPEANRAKLEGYINSEKSFAITSSADNTYRRGKTLAKAANMIPVFHQAGKFAERDAMIAKLKAELVSWYQGSGHSFQYDGIWGGIVGLPYGDINWTPTFNDHNFHYGYFVYASAILALFDPDFATSAQYKGIVDILIRDYASPDRNDASFPFLRQFDVYEGHSWANGKGTSFDGGSDGNDQESISEAMNSWAAIYLWGIVTNNQEWVKLGMYGYTTESKASEEYYFDNHGETYPDDYSHRGGILYDGSTRYMTHWYASTPQEISGIWILPLAPSMLYMGYDTAAASSYYGKMLTESGQNANMWKDILLRYKSLFDAPGALSDWNAWASPSPEEGSSLSYSYHFINFFNSLGTVSTDYYALDAAGNSVPFTVMKSSNNAYTFIAYNNAGYQKDITFFSRSGSGGGTMPVPSGMTVKTKDFQSIKYDNSLVNVPVTQSSNTALSVYSIYSENFLGAIFGGNDYQDKLADPASRDNTITIEGFDQSSPGPFEAYEGFSYFSMARNADATWGGWGFNFADGAMDMSPFYGGKIEFSIRTNNPAAAKKFQAGFQTADGNFIFTLEDLGFDVNSTDWQTLSIPLSSEFSAYITEGGLGYLTVPFYMLHNAGNSPGEWSTPIYIDSILWKKAESPAANFSIKLKNRIDNQPVAVIDWKHSDFRKPDAVAQQYLEIGLNNAVGNSWGIQIYTDNKSSFTVAATEFEGDISSFTASGLVNAGSPGTAMIPMKWRPAPSNIPEEDILWDEPWKDFRDAAAFDSSTGLYNGCDEIKFMDRRGFRHNASDYAPLPEDKKIRLYFIADFTKAKRNDVYRANILVEHYNE